MKLYIQKSLLSTSLSLIIILGTLPCISFAQVTGAPSDTINDSNPYGSAVSSNPVVTGDPQSGTQPSGGAAGGTPSQNTVNNTPTPSKPAVADNSFTPLSNPLGSNNNSIQALLLTVVDLLMNLGIILAVLMIIYAGFRFVWARGNTDELKEAKMLFFYVIVGLVVLITAKVMVNVVKNTLIQANVVDSKVFNSTP